MSCYVWKNIVFMTHIQDDFKEIMTNLPVPFSDEDVEEMFEFADKNKDGVLNYEEFLVKKMVYDISKHLFFYIL